MFRLGRKANEHYASFNRRMWAATIDSLLLMVFVVPFLEWGFAYIYPVPTGVDMLEMERQLADGFGAFWRSFYQSGLLTRWLADFTLQTILFFIGLGICWKKWSSSPGKMMLRMKIVDAETEMPMTDRQIMLRLVGYIVAVLPCLIGIFWISFNRRRQGWHDKMANTVVIVLPKKPKPITPSL